MATSRSHIDDDVNFVDLFRGRRFAAVIVDISAGQLAGDVNGLAWIDGEQQSDTITNGWRVRRVSANFPYTYFPSIPRERFSSSDAYRQDFYLAERVTPPGVALVISPYVRLLNRILSRLNGFMGRDSRLEFVVPDLDDVFLRFERAGYDFMDATRISVKDKNEPTLDVVSLSGKNPLKSNLRQELRKVGPAYSVRMSVSTVHREVNVHLDRFGNFSWYQRDEDDLLAPIRAVDGLLRTVQVTSTTSLPTKRIDETDST